MSAPNRGNKFVVMLQWLVSSWGAVVSIVITISVAIFGSGYWVGSYLTKSEYSNIMMNMRIDHQKEVTDAKEKAKDDAIKEMKDQQAELERLYNIVAGGKKR